MQYHSTRDKSISVSSAEAIKTGLSAEGGLFVPESFPSVSLDEIKNLASKSYNERAYFVLSKFLSDFTEEELKKCIDSAYTKEKFETESIAPVYKLNDTTYFLELWHGPTCAFKDMALQILPHLLTTSMKKTNEDKEIVILVATSGDTGKAALEGFKDVAGTRIIVFYPDNGVSEIQKLQMVTQEGNNVSVAAVKGLPIAKFICASNENNVLTDFIKTGVYNKNRDFHTTISPSMDILISSNLERFLYDLTGCDDKIVSKWMKELNTNGSYEVSADVKAKMQEMFTAGCCDDAETMATIKKCASEYDYVIDTHTAVAKSVYDKYVAQTGDTTKTIIASTASPFKFNQSVLIALEDHNAVVGKDEFTLLKELSEKSNMQIPKSLYELKDKSVVFDLVCDKDEMQQIVSDFLMVE